MLRAALLDIDGTLIDSNNAHAQSWVEALEAHGLDVPFSVIRPLIGMGGDRLLLEVAAMPENSIHGKAIAITRKRIFQDKYLPNLEAFPEVRELLLRMRDEGMQIFVATSSGGEMLNELLDRAHILDLVENAESSAAPRSAPEIILAALKLSGFSSSDAIMIGDTPFDEEAARKAGVEFIGFECGGWTTNDFHLASAVYKDASDLLKNFASSPLAKSHQQPTMIEMTAIT